MALFIVAKSNTGGTGGVGFIGTGERQASDYLALNGAEEKIASDYARQLSIAAKHIPAKVESINAILEQDDQKILLLEVDLTHDPTDPTARLRRGHKDTPQIAGLRSTPVRDAHYSGLVMLIAQDQRIQYDTKGQRLGITPMIVVPAVKLAGYIIKNDYSTVAAQQPSGNVEIDPLGFYFASGGTMHWPNDLKAVAGKQAVAKHLEAIAGQNYKQIMEMVTTA